MRVRLSTLVMVGRIQDRKDTRPEGIDYVINNGTIAVKYKEIVNTSAGKILRNYRNN
ncbi:MAG TPA: hypothetical protein VN258_16380 [Mobilitalea sp.]|nr:hypothetical protein [Mobilitalea sp.]